MYTRSCDMHVTCSAPNIGLCLVLTLRVSEANDKLRRLAAVLPDAASLSPLSHDTSKRADPEVLQRLVQHAKSLRVSE